MTPIFTDVSPTLDGSTVTLGDGTVRTRHLNIPSGEYATPFWLRLDGNDDRLVHVTSLPWDGVVHAGQVEVLSSEPQAVGASAVFSDGFESGDLTYTEGDFAWDSFGSPTVNSNQVRTGSFSCHLDFPLDDDRYLQGRWSPRTDVTELWCEYYLWIPNTWDHPTLSEVDGNDLRKFQRFFNKSRTIASDQIAVQTNLRGMESGESSLTVLYTNDGTFTGDAGTISPFIATGDLGSWMHLRWHVRPVSAAGAGDDLIWIEKNGSVVLNESGLDPEWTATSVSDNWFDLMRIMGSVNYTASTEWDFYVDDWKLWDSDPGWG